MSLIKKTTLALAALTVTTALAAQARADDIADNGDYISVNGGYYDILRKDQKAGQFGAEYRVHDVSYWLHPIVGAFATTKGSTYGYAGFNWNVPLLKDELYLIPSLSVGAYDHGGGKNLGGVFEFRDSIEIDYQLPNAQMLGVSLNHLSNAGIYSHNPGEETLMGTYSVPFRTISGWVGGN